MKDFNTVYKTTVESDEYKQFIKENPDYYLAHGFTQLDGKGEQQKPWQIGFYAKNRDNLAVFTTEPTGYTFEKAFKDGGTIEKLEINSAKKTKEIFNIVKQLIDEKYPEELPGSYIVIIQNIDGKAGYNITAVTQSFSMINVKILAETGEVTSQKKNSILDLRKE